MAKRALLSSFFVLLSFGPLRAGGITLGLASGSIAVECIAEQGIYQYGTGMSHDLSNMPTGTSVAAACDFTRSYQYPPETVTAIGDGVLTIGKVPSISIQGEMVISGVEAWAGYFSGTGQLSYSVAIEQTGTPPQPVTAIPVTITSNSETSGFGASSDTWFDAGGGNYFSWADPSNVSFMWSFVPGTEYSAGIDAYCDADAPDFPEWQSCQVSVDPAFQFDQADFKGGFQLSDYYSFVYSPNLTPTGTATPEPCSLLLFGTNLLILAPLLRRRFGCN